MARNLNPLLSCHIWVWAYIVEKQVGEMTQKRLQKEKKKIVWNIKLHSEVQSEAKIKYKNITLVFASHIFILQPRRPPCKTLLTSLLITASYTSF